MNDQEKRALLRKIFGDPQGAIAPGITDALFARLAQDCGYRALHLSGNAIHRNFCLPDRNLLTVTQIAQHAAQIAEATDIPLIVDGGSACVETIALARAVQYYERAGAAAVALRRRACERAWGFRRRAGDRTNRAYDRAHQGGRRCAPRPIARADRAL